MSKKPAIDKVKKTKRESLNSREQKFVEAMADPQVKSHTEAAIIAGYSPATARIIASKKLTKVNISEAIERRKQQVTEHAKVTPEEVLGFAVFQMRSSMADVLNEKGELDLEKARETGAIDLIKKYKKTTVVDPVTGTTETTTEIELHSSAEARREVAKYINSKNFKFKVEEADGEMELAQELLYRMVNRHNWTVEKAKAGVAEQFPGIDVNLLTL